MRKRLILALSLVTPVAIAATDPQTDETYGQCIIVPPVPYNPPTTEDTNKNNQQIEISSDYSESKLGQSAVFQGDVSLSQADRRITADKASVDQRLQQLSADGSLVFQDSMITVTAESMQAQMRSNVASLTGAQYWLHGQQLHGKAKNLQITKNNNLILQDSSFTTCPPENESWVLEARRIRIDSKDEWGEIWDAKLRVGGVPVFYIPYMTIPITDKRKTGFLFPTFSSSTTNGIEVSTPYYWNISPEYDLTFTPTYMSSRGLFTKTEFRYLAGDDQQGQVNLEYLGSDGKLENSPDRYMFHWQQQGALDENWRVRANFTDVSDNNYFNDLKSDVNRATDNQLNRVGDLGYYTDNWDFGVRVQDIKVLGEDESPYQVMPQLTYNFRAPRFWQGLDFSLYSELTNFEHRGEDWNSADRLHFEPTITLPIQGPAGSLTSELKLLQTNYWQHNISDNELQETVNRTLPQVRVHGQINFERQTNYFDENYRQTLEPQFQYLYVGYRNQDEIGIYDSADLQQDYTGLFRDRRYSGLDRIADANQLTLGLTTRLFDEHNLEQLKFSLGQILYFENSKVNLYSDELRQESSTSVLAAELDAHLYSDWFISGAIQYDTRYKENKKSEVTLDYRPGPNKLVQLSYRFVPDLLNRNTNDRVDISQAGFRTTWPVTNSLYFVGNWYYDLNEDRSVETYTGFQYESCCWAVRLAYHYHIKTNYQDNYNPAIDNRELFETGFYLNFVIKGLGGTGPLGVDDMMNDGLFNYRKPLYLRN
ncbi:MULTISPECIES: LPS assembly protein LptD [Shewanella]|jgi:LPS-assembly protein|uniref:LPS assembly protein LptD n=1 Tax=Shewanella TaxID=22 RepID=UPI0016784C32|nr:MULTISPECIES: LPS assembly protein LptD [Shewanella]MBO1272762.1 LPS assembly protein LptD [Shewanella sp. 4t3-1-2LB]MCL2905689.1 LPS assembly protein LptD [Shewanella fodinae]GGY97639.1 LPS-assembly protein LptD [Shewanella fodinae]